MRDLKSIDDCFERGLLRRVEPSRTKSEQSILSARDRLSEAEKNLEGSLSFCPSRSIPGWSAREEPLLHWPLLAEGSLEEDCMRKLEEDYLMQVPIADRVPELADEYRERLYRKLKPSNEVQ